MLLYDIPINLIFCLASNTKINYETMKLMLMTVLENTFFQETVALLFYLLSTEKNKLTLYSSGHFVLKRSYMKPAEQTNAPGVV